MTKKSAKRIQSNRPGNTKIGLDQYIKNMIDSTGDSETITLYKTANVGKTESLLSFLGMIVEKEVGVGAIIRAATSEAAYQKYVCRYREQDIEKARKIDGEPMGGKI